MFHTIVQCLWEWGAEVRVHALPIYCQLTIYIITIPFFITDQPFSIFSCVWEFSSLGYLGSPHVVVVHLLVELEVYQLWCIEPADFNFEAVDLLVCMKNFEVLVCNLMDGRYAPRLLQNVFGWEIKKFKVTKQTVRCHVAELKDQPWRDLKRCQLIVLFEGCEYGRRALHDGLGDVFLHIIT